jgi:hypothetical protein
LLSGVLGHKANGLTAFVAERLMSLLGGLSGDLWLDGLCLGYLHVVDSMQMQLEVTHTVQSKAYTWGHASLLGEQSGRRLVVRCATKLVA